MTDEYDFSLMPIVPSKNNIPVRLTEERWGHIESRHPEMRHHKAEVLETIAEPDFIQQGDFGVLLAARRYPHTALTSKYVMVAYRELGQTDGFVLTAYLSSRPASRRPILWKR